MEPSESIPLPAGTQSIGMSFIDPEEDMAKLRDILEGKNKTELLRYAKNTLKVSGLQKDLSSEDIRDDIIEEMESRHDKYTEDEFLAAIQDPSPEGGRPQPEPVEEGAPSPRREPRSSRTSSRRSPRSPPPKRKPPQRKPPQRKPPQRKPPQRKPPQRKPSRPSSRYRRYRKTKKGSRRTKKT